MSLPYTGTVKIAYAKYQETIAQYVGKKSTTRVGLICAESLPVHVFNPLPDPGSEIGIYYLPLLQSTWLEPAIQ